MEIIDNDDIQSSDSLPRVLRVDALGGAVLGSTVFIVCDRKVLVVRVVVAMSSCVVLTGVNKVSVILKITKTN